MYDFYKTAAAVPDLKVADVVYNKNKIIEKIDDSETEDFEELSVEGDESYE